MMINIKNLFNNYLENGVIDMVLCIVLKVNKMFHFHCQAY